MATMQESAFADTQDQEIYKGQIRSMIAELAYSYAEERGFEGGDPTDEWLRADRSVKTMLAGGGKPRLLRIRDCGSRHSLPEQRHIQDCARIPSRIDGASADRMHPERVGMPRF